MYICMLSVVATLSSQLPVKKEEVPKVAVATAEEGKEEVVMVVMVAVERAV